MTHWAKFRRAYEHLHVIDDVIGRFLDMKPYRLVSEYDPKPPFPANSRVKFTLRLHAPVLPPPELPALIGDCLTNLRATLDHLIYGIALKHTGRTEIFDNLALAFPIYDDASKWASWLGRIRETKGGPFLLPDEVLTRLKNRQPYQGVNSYPAIAKKEIERKQLWVLNALVNADKHRTLVPVTHLRVRDVVVSSTIPGDGALAGATISGSYKHGEVIFPYAFVPDSPHAEVSVNTEFDPEVAFGEEWPTRGMPVSRMLHGLCDFIREEIFPEFESFL